MVDAGIEQSKEGCLTPELLRREGEFFLLQGSPAAADTAEELFRQALDLRAGTRHCLGIARCDEPRPAAAQSGPLS
jgi:hypothetical protein